MCVCVCVIKKTHSGGGRSPPPLWVGSPPHYAVSFCRIEGRCMCVCMILGRFHENRMLYISARARIESVGVEGM